MKKIILALCLILALAACQGRQLTETVQPENQPAEAVQPDTETQSSDTEQQESAAPADNEAESSEAAGTEAEPPAEASGVTIDPAGQVMQPADSPSSENPDAQSQTATLYIGSSGSGFTEYPVSCTGTLTPDWLIGQISDLTGWNLDLAEPVSTGKGGMTVDFANTSALVVGPPDPQKEEFFVYDNVQLTQTILDSIQRTLQYNFIDPELGDPSNLDVYFCLEGGDISLEGGAFVPHTQPYQGLMAE